MEDFCFIDFANLVIPLYKMIIIERQTALSVCVSSTVLKYKFKVLVLYLRISLLCNFLLVLLRTFTL